jgi:hypothetical protein
MAKIIIVIIIPSFGHAINFLGAPSPSPARTELPVQFSPFFLPVLFML